MTGISFFQLRVIQIEIKFKGGNTMVALTEGSMLLNMQHIHYKNFQDYPEW